MAYLTEKKYRLCLNVSNINAIESKFEEQLYALAGSIHLFDCHRFL